MHSFQQWSKWWLGEYVDIVGQQRREHWHTDWPPDRPWLPSTHRHYTTSLPPATMPMTGWGENTSVMVQGMWALLIIKLTTCFTHSRHTGESQWTVQTAGLTTVNLLLCSAPSAWRISLYDFGSIKSSGLKTTCMNIAVRNKSWRLCNYISIYRFLRVHGQV